MAPPLTIGRVERPAQGARGRTSEGELRCEGLGLEAVRERHQERSVGVGVGQRPAVHLQADASTNPAFANIKLEGSHPRARPQPIAKQLCERPHLEILSLRCDAIGEPRQRPAGKPPLLEDHERDSGEEHDGEEGAGHGGSAEREGARARGREGARARGRPTAPGRR